MARKQAPAPKKKPADTRTQAERFEQFAREHGADDPEALGRAMGPGAKRLRKPKPTEKL